MVGLVVLLGLGIVTWMILLFAGRMANLFAARTANHDEDRIGPTA